MKLNQYIDHTILKPAATAADVEAICREAVEYEFASVCVNTCHVRLVSRLLSGSPVKNLCGGRLSPGSYGYRSQGL